ncbi:MAG: extracellular solute-binding protein [Armatimonadetes bacterium]|nr:extracellular solute-binding protein [Armatimonadota bacterium]
MRPSVRFACCLASVVALCSVATADVTLRLVVWDGDDGLGVVRQAAKEFEAAHPGIHVRLENVPYGQYATKLLAQVAAGASPDVAMMEPKMYQGFARRGACVSLDGFFGQTPDFRIDDYYKPIVDVHRFEGKLYVLPRDIAPIGLIYYNKRLFKEAGLAYPDGTWTWDWKPRPELKEKDFTWVIQQLSKRDAKGKPVQWGFVPAWTRAFADTVVYSQGLRYVDDPVHPTRWNWTDPGIVKAYQWIADLGMKEQWIPSSTEISNVLMSSSDKLFLEQKAAMFQCGIWAVPAFRKALKPGSKEWFDWDITLAPGHIDPRTGKAVRAAPTGGSGYAMMSSCRHQKEAWLLTTWMAGPPAMRLMAKAGLAQPAIKRLALEEPWVPGPSTPEDQRYPPSRKFTDEAVASVVFDPTADYYLELNTYYESKVDSVMAGTLTAERAFSLADNDAKIRLRQILNQQSLPPFNWPFAAIGGTAVVAGVLLWLYGPRQRKLSLAERKENRAAYGFLLPWIIGALALTLGPMILSLFMSLADWDIMTPAHWRGVGNYTEAFSQDPRFWGSLRVTALYTVFAVPLGLVVSLAMALLLNTKVKGIALYRTCFYLPALASTVATSLVFKKLFQAEGGLINSVIYGGDGHGDLFGIGWLLEKIAGAPGPANWLGNERLALPALVLMSLWGAGSGMVILLAGLQGIPQFYYEAATLDGAGPWQKFKAVTFPLLTPSLFFTLVTGVIASFQIFTQAFVMTSGGPNDSTRFFILHLYNQAFEALRMGYSSALAWILFAVILVFTALQWRLNRYVHYEAEAK